MKKPISLKSYARRLAVDFAHEGSLSSLKACGEFKILSTSLRRFAIERFKSERKALIRGER